jgi:hypothetical protein
MAENTELLPFHAINEFMRPDFRLTVIRETLTNQSATSLPCFNDLNQQIKKRVTVPGFRHSDKAPGLIKVLPTSKAFEKHPDLVAAILTCWTESQAEFREQVYTLLKTRNWPMLAEGESLDFSALNMELIKSWPVFPEKMDRSKLPGFYPHWFKGEDFEVLYTNFTSLFPDTSTSIDRVSLMAVWLCMRLPYQVDKDLPSSPAQEEAEKPE